jgi:dihydrofolate synthase/folylpolyglutamate synthase
VKNTKLQGRFEIVSKEPRIILDSAHNHDGISCLVDEFSKEKKNYKESALLFGAMKDKNIEEMLKKVKDLFDSFYFYEFDNERAASIELLKENADKLSIKFEIARNLKDFLIVKLKGDKRNCLVVAGSMYLVGEVKSVLPELLS